MLIEVTYCQTGRHSHSRKQTSTHTHTHMFFVKISHILTLAWDACVTWLIVQKRSDIKFFESFRFGYCIECILVEMVSRENYYHPYYSACMVNALTTFIRRIVAILTVGRWLTEFCQFILNAPRRYYVIYHLSILNWHDENVYKQYT